MLLKKTLFVVSLTAVLAACSTATNEKWQNFDNKSLNENISSTDAVLLFIVITVASLLQQSILL